MMTSSNRDNSSSDHDLWTVFDCNIIHLPKNESDAGSLTYLQNSQFSAFTIKRVYYLYDVPGGACRGGHAHYNLEQLIVAASGSFDIVIDDAVTKRTISLNRPYYGLHLRPGIWRELVNFSSGSICLVLASEVYQEEDYIRNYEQFQEYHLDNKRVNQRNG